MAYLNDDDKQQGQNQGGQPTDPSQSGMGQGGGFVGAGSPVSTAGINKGGTGGWTNIQAYLQANQGNNQGSVDAFNKQVTGALDSDKQALNTQANDTKQKAQTEADRTKVGQDQASKLIEQAGQNYQYGAQQDAAKTQAYRQPIQQIQNTLGAQWGGPNSFAAGMGAEAQKVGGINADPNFKSYMNDIYRQSAGGRIGVGGLSLQNQLDANNEGLAQARQGALQKYADLQNYYGDTVKGVNDTIQGAQGQFNQNKTDLRNTLTGGADARLKALQDKVSQYGKDEDAIKAVQGDHVANYNNQGDVDAYFQRQGTDSQGHKYTQNQLMAMNENPYRQDYKAGDQANLENIGGAENDRNQYNAIMDALGLTNRVNQADKFAQHGTAAHLDQDAWQKALSQAAHDIPWKVGGPTSNPDVRWGGYNFTGTGRRGIDSIDRNVHESN